MLYSIIAWLLVPSTWWGRLRVSGIEHLPERGPVVLVPNHDSQWDPIAIALAVRRHRSLRFLGRASLWKVPGLGPILYAIGQIPIERGAHDTHALREAAEGVLIDPPAGPSAGGPNR